MQPVERDSEEQEPQPQTELNKCQERIIKTKKPSLLLSSPSLSFIQNKNKFNWLQKLQSFNWQFELHFKINTNLQFQK